MVVTCWVGTGPAGVVAGAEATPETDETASTSDE